MQELHAYICMILYYVFTRRYAKKSMGCAVLCYLVQELHAYVYNVMCAYKICKNVHEVCCFDCHVLQELHAYMYDMISCVYKMLENVHKV
jgi:hypothetical protein